MAITPSEARKRAAPDPEMMRRLEDRVDQILVDRLRTGYGDSVYIDTSVFPDAASRDAIINRYALSGWSVSHQSDQREGGYLVFSARQSDQRDGRSCNYWDGR